MPGRVEGKVAFITGAARGQGRSHAVRLAQEGADIIAVDVCQQIRGVPFPMSTPDDLKETVRLVEEQDRRIVAAQADVRDYAALKAAVDDGVAQLGRLDIVVANAGIGNGGKPLAETDEQTWQDMIDVNLTGVWLSTKAAIPHMIATEILLSLIVRSAGLASSIAAAMARTRSRMLTAACWAAPLAIDALRLPEVPGP